MRTHKPHINALPHSSEPPRAPWRSAGMRGSVWLLMALFWLPLPAQGQSAKPCVKQFKSGKRFQAAECFVTFARSLAKETPTPRRRVMETRSWRNAASIFATIAKTTKDTNKAAYLRERAAKAIKQILARKLYDSPSAQLQWQARRRALIQSIGYATLSLKVPAGGEATITGYRTRLVAKGTWQSQLRPGLYTLTLAHPKATSADKRPRSIKLTKGQPQVLVLTLTPPPKPRTRPRPRPRLRPKPRTRPRPRRTRPRVRPRPRTRPTPTPRPGFFQRAAGKWMFFGIGAGLALAGGTGLLAAYSINQNKEQSFALLRDRERESIKPTEINQLAQMHDQATLFRNLGWAAIGAGGASLIIAGILALVPNPKAQAPAAASPTPPRRNHLSATTWRFP